MKRCLLFGAKYCPGQETRFSVKIVDRQTLDPEVSTEIRSRHIYLYWERRHLENFNIS